MSDESHNKVEHLKMIQDVTARLAGNSVQMKTWAVALVTSVFVFSGLSQDPHWLIAVGGGVAVVTFWLLDARYLYTAYAHGSGRESLPPDVEVEVRAGERVECCLYVPADGATT